MRDFNEPLVRKGLRKLGYGDSESENYLKTINGMNRRYLFYSVGSWLAAGVFANNISADLPEICKHISAASFFGYISILATSWAYNSRRVNRAVETLEHLGSMNIKSPPEGSGLDDIIKKLPAL